jgi:hypothetical protein
MVHDLIKCCADVLDIEFIYDRRVSPWLPIRRGASGSRLAEGKPQRGGDLLRIFGVSNWRTEAS